MPRFASFDGTNLAYEVAGEGAPVVLLHGFAADARGNWGEPGVIKALVAAGRQVISVDARGHGQSDKPHDPAAYGDDAMVKDVQALLDHLDITECDIAGYSMGALVTTRLLPVESRVRSAVLGGIGGGAARSRPMAASSAIADALVADDPKSVADPTARAFRAFADSTGADRHALAAIQRAPRFTSAPDLGSISIPVLILIGDNDTLVGSPDELAGLIAGSRVQLVSGDHLSAVMDPAFPRHIVEFFREVEARAGR